MATGLLEGVIANMPMFRHVARAHLAELARHARVQHVRRGATVCRRGESLNCFFGVAYGLIKLALRADSGEEKVLRLVGAGETFGEALVFRERPNPLDAVALADTMLVVFPSPAVIALLEHDPSFARGLLDSLSERMHNMVAEIDHPKIGHMKILGNPVKASAELARSLDWKAVQLPQEAPCLTRDTRRRLVSQRHVQRSLARVADGTAAVGPHVSHEPVVQPQASRGQWAQWTGRVGLGVGREHAARRLRGTLPDRARGEHQDVAPPARQLEGRGTADDAGADNDNVA